MAQTNYERGVEKERLILETAESLGYQAAMRTAGSHGPFDVILLSPLGVRLIQVKRCKKFSQSGFDKDREKIQELVKPKGSISFEIWVWQDYKGWIRQEVIQ